MIPPAMWVQAYVKWFRFASMLQYFANPQFVAPVGHAPGLRRAPRPAFFGCGFAAPWKTIYPPNFRNGQSQSSKTQSRIGGPLFPLPSNAAPRFLAQFPDGRPPGRNALRHAVIAD
jgi:hypothetical protein